MVFFLTYVEIPSVPLKCGRVSGETSGVSELVSSPLSSSKRKRGLSLETLQHKNGSLNVQGRNSFVCGELWWKA